MFAHVCIICCIGLYYIVVSGRFLKLKCETILKTLRLAVIHESLFVVWCQMYGVARFGYIAFYSDVYPSPFRDIRLQRSCSKKQKSREEKEAGPASWCFLWFGMVWIICFLEYLGEGDQMPKSLKTRGTAWQCFCLVGKCVMVISTPPGAPPRDIQSINAAIHINRLHFALDCQIQLPLFAGWKWDRATPRCSRSRAQCLEKLTCTLQCW